MDAETTLEQSRSWLVLERLSGVDINRAASLMPRKLRKDAVRKIGLTHDMLATHPEADIKLRNRLRNWSPKAQADAMHFVFSGVLARIVDALGPASDNPSKEELLASIDYVIDEITAPLVATVLAFAVDMEFNAARHCAELLEVDPRFALEAIGPVASDRPALITTHVVGLTPSDPIKVETRRERKRAAKAARVDSPVSPRYKRRRGKVIDLESEQSSAGLARNTTRSKDAERRHVNCIRAYDEIDYEHELVTRIVKVPIYFAGPILGTKVRPAVVIAAVGRHHIVVRPIYSAGGFAGRTWKSSPISDTASAKLDRNSVISNEERCIPISQIHSMLGTLAPADWNLL